MNDILKYSKLTYRFFYIIFFFSFIGYYSVILLTSNFISLELSRIITIPLRIILLLSLVIVFIINVKKTNALTVNNLFLVFMVVYILRIFVDYNNESAYYLPFTEVFLYFISFSVIPYLVISKFKLNDRIIHILFNSLLYSGFLFSVLVLIYYGKYVGEVSRLGKGLVEESVLNPLALSYSSVLIISVFSFYLLQNKLSKVKKGVAIISIILSIIPFFLGASRGALIALLITFLVYLFTSRNVKSIVNISIVSIIFAGSIIFFDGYLNSGLIDRILQTSEDIDNQNSSAERLVIWENALEQFVNNPFFGDKLAVNNWESYAHNIIIETLQTTGVLGFIPFIIIIIYAWKKVIYIAVNHKNYFWICVIFIQSFVQSMFSGALYVSSWFWMSLAILLALIKFLTPKYYLK